MTIYISRRAALAAGAAALAVLAGLGWYIVKRQA